MSIVHRTLENIRRRKPRINRAKIAATTEADIRQHMREDGQDKNDLMGFAPIIPPQVLRKQLHMTQTEFARALRIPIATAQLGTRSCTTGSSCSFTAGRCVKKSTGDAQGTYDKASGLTSCAWALARAAAIVPIVVVGLVPASVQVLGS
jgi:DNA-binding transcriptional regulator YiaG